MTVQELISALQQCNPEMEVDIDYTGFYMPNISIGVDLGPDGRVYIAKVTADEHSGSL